MHVCRPVDVVVSYLIMAVSVNSPVLVLPDKLKHTVVYTTQGVTSFFKGGFPGREWVAWKRFRMLFKRKVHVTVVI